MAGEGRFSTVVTFADHPRSQLLQEENYMNRAVAAGDEMIERQKQQLIKLVKLLKNVETQINSRHKSLFQDLADHQAFLEKFFIKVFGYVSAIQHSGRLDDLSYMLPKILTASFRQVGNALGSVEIGIDELICELAREMCRPMVEYVNGLKREMQTGTCSSFLEIIKEMDREIKIKSSELEEAREQARLAEKSKNEALDKLKKSEETVRNLTISLGSLTGDYSTESAGEVTQEKPSITKQDPVKDDHLLWEVLRIKRKCQILDSPPTTQELLDTGAHNKKHKLTTLSSHRPFTRAQTRSYDRRSSSINSRMLLAASTFTNYQLSFKSKVSDT